LFRRIGATRFSTKHIPFMAVVLEYRGGTWEYSSIGNRSKTPIPSTFAAGVAKRSALSITFVQSAVGIALSDRKPVDRSIPTATRERWEDG